MKDRAVNPFDRARLITACHQWRSREYICGRTGWTPRYLRAVAESFGSDLVRGPRGLKLTECLTPEDKAHALEAVRQRRNQAKKDFRYARELEKRIAKL